MVIFKVIKIGILLLFLLVSIPFVFADENNTTDIQELNDEISLADDTLNLTKDYTSFEGELNISKDIAIEGNNHSISSNDSGGVLKINVCDSCNLIFRNITFNCNVKLNANESNVTFFNTCFNISLESDAEIPGQYCNITFGKAGNVSKTIINKAKKIAGNSKDLKAAKKLASWIGKNISHETMAGFYQSPEDTLKRKTGNCCSQTLLFLQMCEALGITENHDVYFVHVGLKEFGNRHFFAIIDNLCVDVDSKPGSPWGHARINYDSIFTISKYPSLPLAKEY